MTVCKLEWNSCGLWRIRLMAILVKSRHKGGAQLCVHDQLADC